MAETEQVLAGVRRAQSRWEKVERLVLLFGVVLLLGAVAANTAGLWIQIDSSRTGRRILRQIQDQTSPAAQQRQAQQIETLLQRISCNDRNQIVLVFHSLAPTLVIHVPATTGCPAIDIGGPNAR